MPDEDNLHFSEDSSSAKGTPEPSRKNTTGRLDIKEKDVVLCFCILLAIVGVVFAAHTGNQWWLTLLGPFTIILTKKGDGK
jgi:hypothetical protein